MSKPYIDASLNLGFMGFYTHIMTHRFEAIEFEYIALHWYFFKWNGKFRLYKRERR